ncbi:HpcH/HpaI aldolase/citrate lyase family protein [Emcibacter nanhaiensis]|nr:CoA ester lyase [Emcibacter nanhaiensis]
MRLERSMLAVPATSPHFFAKAAASEADIIFLDLEDSVTPERKNDARTSVIEALNTVDWRDKNMSVRINEIDSEWGYRDIVHIVEQCPRLDALLVPKVAAGEDIRFVARLLDALETHLNRDRSILIDALIETPAGVTNVDEIAAASPRLSSLSFGVGDYSVAMQAPQTSFGSPDPRYGILGAEDGNGKRGFHWNDQWHYALARIANACHANGVMPVDGPFTDFRDAEGYRACAHRARALGYAGKWAIHPSQIVAANEVFSPRVEELDLARRINAAMAKAMKQGDGAVQLDGRMVDLAHVKQASALLLRQETIAKRASQA